MAGKNKGIQEDRVSVLNHTVILLFLDKKSVPLAPSKKTNDYAQPLVKIKFYYVRFNFDNIICILSSVNFKLSIPKRVS